MAFAEVEDLQDYLGNEWDVLSDRGRAARLLRQASALARKYAKRTWDASTVPEDVVDVVCAAAGRSFTNPNAEKSEQLDDYSTSRVVGEAGLYFTDSEILILEEYKKPAFRGLGTVSTERGDIRTADDEQSWWVNGPNGWTE